MSTLTCINKETMYHQLVDNMELVYAASTSKKHMHIPVYFDSTHKALQTNVCHTINIDIQLRKSTHVALLAILMSYPT